MMMIPINNSESVGMDIREFRENTLETIELKKPKTFLPCTQSAPTLTHESRSTREAGHTLFD